MVDRQVGSDPPCPGTEVAIGAKLVPRAVDAPESLHGQILGNAWVAHNTHGPGVDVALKLTYQRLDLAMREPLEQIHELLYPVFTGYKHAGYKFFGARQRRSRAPIAPEAAACRMRRKVGHSIWLGARQAAACRRPSRISVSLRMVLSNSLALAASICRSRRGRPSGANMSAISSSEKPAERPRAIRARRSNTPGSKTR